MEPAAEAVEVIADFSPWNLCSLENAPPTQPLWAPPSNLPLKKRNRQLSFPSVLGGECVPGFVQAALAGLVPFPFPGWGLIMHVLLCFIVQICVCDVVGTDK